MKRAFAFFFVSFAIGCGSPASVCKSVTCPTSSMTYESCAQANGDVDNTFGSASCTCKAGDVSGCQQCAMLIANYCGGGTGGNGGGTGGNGGGGGPDGGTGPAQMGGVMDCTPGGSGTSARFVFDSITLPAQRTDYAFDLTGSGRLQNQYGVIIGALEQQNLDPQAGVDQSLQSGQTVMLLEETSTDASFTTDSCASAIVQAGAATNFPPTEGANYVPSGTPADFAGPIGNARFDSAAPATTKKPVTLPMVLPMLPATAPVPLHLIGAHVQFTNQLGRVMSGQINGAIKKSEIDNTLIPAVAQTLENKIMMDQGNPTSTDMSILSLFDTGGSASATPAMGCSANPCGNTCQNPSTVPHACMCAQSGDGYIDECEVATNSIIKSILAPDVQMFDANGNYAPNPQPTATSKDSLSIGLGFTAIPANF